MISRRSDMTINNGKIITGKSITVNSIIITAASGCILLMISPELSVSAAKKGLDLWFYTVIPSMLPFFIFTDMLVKSGVHISLGKLLERPVRFVMGTSGAGAFAFVTSVISGYPAGARIIGEMCRKGDIKGKDAGDMLSFCSTSGPLFIVGAAGAGMLGSSKAGYLILVSHYISAIATGLFFAENSLINRALSGKRTKISESYINIKSEIDDKRADFAVKNNKIAYSSSLTDVMAEAIRHSFAAIIIIGGFIILFSILTEYICHFMPIILSYIGSGTGTGAYDTDAVVKMAAGLLEMTVGCSSISSISDISMEIKTILCSFYISFGGISVAAQSMSMMRGTGMKTADYLRLKVFQGITSAAVTMGFIHFMW